MNVLAIVVAKDEETARHIHPGSTPGNPVVGYNAETYHYDKAWYESVQSAARR